MLIQLQLLSSIRRSFSLLYSAAAFPQAAKARRDVCDVSPLLLVLLRVMRRWTFAYMHVLWL